VAFEQFLTQKQDAKQSKRWRSVTYVASLLLHGAFFTGMVVRSFWNVDELQPPTVHVTMASLRPPPPPPPPAAAPKAEAVKPKVVVRPRPTNQIVQPTPEERPKAVAEAATDDEGGEAGGEAGGVEGGVATAAPPPPPPPPPTKHVEPLAILLPPNVGLGQRLSDLSDPRYRPSLPPQLNRAGMIVWGLYRICVAVDGRVENVRVLKSADQLVDDRWVALIRSWEYRPYSIEGRAVPFCHAMRIEARAAL
jgi:periplasmic protein TonB